MTQQANHPPASEGDSPKRIIPRFRMRPSLLAAAFTGFAILVMISLGAFIIREYRSLQLQFHGKVGSVYIDNLLVPIALSFHNGTPVVKPGAEAVFRKLAEGDSPLVLRIWSLDGTLVYSTFQTGTLTLHDTEDLSEALNGTFVAKLETEGVTEEGFPLSFPFLEIYAPIHDPVTGRMIAVGETYQDATRVLRDRTFVERTVWVAVALATLGVLALLALTFSQNAELEDRLALQQRLTRQNDRLRREAVQARLDAAQANEQVLNLVGAELHDGPVQLLGLMSLMQNGGATGELPDGTTLADLRDQVMTQLRTLSAGLILPELEALDAAGVVTLAVERHEALTGSKVALEIAASLPALNLARRVCLYRVVQEGLTNTARHAEGTGPDVRIGMRDTALDIRIRSGPSRVKDAGPGTPTARLGLQGMRRRLEVFGGTLELETTQDATLLRVCLPVHGADGDPA